MTRFALLLLIAPIALAQTVVHATPRGVLVAQHGMLQLFDRNGRDVVWSTEGVQTPTAMATSNDRAAVLDALANEVCVINLATRQATTIHTGETPIDGLFAAGALYLLERDARALERIGSDGTRVSIEVAADPAFVRQSNGLLYVYSRLEGLLQEVTISPFAVRRTARMPPFASAFEADARHGYLVYPRAANIAVITLATMTGGGKIDVGAVPVDLAFTSSPTALTARTLAVADPSGKRVWLIEGVQSVTQAVTRGFLRGLLGLGLFGGSGSQFPTGVDRVVVAGPRWYAYDSSSGTLYRFTRRTSTIVAKNIAATAFSAGPGGLFVWDDAVRRLQRFQSE